MLREVIQADCDPNGAKRVTALEKMPEVSDGPSLTAAVTTPWPPGGDNFTLPVKPYLRDDEFLVYP